MDEKQKKTFCYADEWMPLVPETYRARTKAQWLADFTRWGFPLWMRSGISIRSEPIFKREEISAFFAHRFKGWPSSYEALIASGSFPEVKAPEPDFLSRRRPRKQKGNRKSRHPAPKLPMRKSERTRTSTILKQTNKKAESP